MTSHNWIPLLEGDVAKSAARAVDGVRLELEDAVAAVDPPLGLSGGLAGYALTLAVLDQSSNFRVSGETDAQSALALVADRIENTDLKLGLYAGIAGIGWSSITVAKLLGNSVSDALESVRSIDEAITELVHSSPWPHDYDLINGLVGYGVYALSHPDLSVGAAIFEGVVSRLRELAQTSPGRVWWHTSRHLILNPGRYMQYPTGYRDLGIAHGIPGVIALFARATSRNIGGEVVRELLAYSIEFVLDQQQSAPRRSKFRSFVEENEDSRLAWCYGDLGIAAAIYGAGRATGSSRWIDTGLEIAASCCRRSPPATGVVDAGLCHGAAGVGHIYNCFFQETRDDLFRRSAIQWFDNALAMRSTDPALGSFPRFDPTKMSRVIDHSLLTGSAGVALALSAALGGPTPVWNEMMLLTPHYG